MNHPLFVHWSLVLLTLGASAGAADQPGPPRVVVHVHLDDQMISPVTVRYVQRALREAETVPAQALLIEIDTPGGLLDSTRRMVREILASRVPVVVYVSPTGARAASAGLFVTLSAHVAAMAPGTRIGAAHPVQMGRRPWDPQPTESPGDAESNRTEDHNGQRRRSPAEAKIIEDTVAWVRSLAELRGRDAEWAELAVTESRSIGAAEAVRNGVVDLLAEDWQELLRQIDGREIELNKHRVQLQTAGAELRTIEMWWGEQVLAALANPNLALLLLILGFYGVLFEFYSPGWGVAGTLGVLCLLLAFSGLAVLPVNYAGLALIALALGLFVAEVFVPSFGALTLGGIASLVLGGLMLIDTPAGFGRVSLVVLIPIAVATAIITLLLVTGIVRVHRQRVQTGDEDLAGRAAVAVQDFSKRDGGYRGSVRVLGETWQATSRHPVAAGESVAVRSREGLVLEVDRPEKSETES